MELTINKALRLKSRVTEKIGKLKKTIELNNSYREDLGCKYAVNELWDDLTKLTDYLVNLKAAITMANIPIVDKLHRIAELKGLCTTLNVMSTKEGPVENNSFRRLESDPATYEWSTFFSEDVVDEMLTAYKEEIDDNQDRIDKFNSTTVIEVEECPVKL